MKKFNLFVIVLSITAFVVVLVLRMQYKEHDGMSSDSLAVYGLVNGIAVESGDVIDGIYISLPDGLDPDEMISVSSDPDVAYIVIGEAGKDRMINSRIEALSAGIAELYIRSADGNLSTQKYTVNVIANSETVDITTSDVADFDDTENFQDDFVYVYVTPTGEKYHLSSNCAGDTGMCITLEEAVAKEYEPCKRCAMVK